MDRDPFALPERTMNFIEHMVRTAPNGHVMNYQDGEDLRSECYVAVLKARENFREGHGATLATFLEKVVRDAVNRFFRDRARLKRSCVRFTLDEIVVNPDDEDDGDSEVCRRVDVIAAPGADADREAKEEALDRESFLATIADRKVRVATRLMLEGETLKKDISKAVGIPYGKYRYGVEPRAKACVEAFLKS